MAIELWNAGARHSRPISVIPAYAGIQIVPQAELHRGDGFRLSAALRPE